jgi:hypothetical protein
LVNSYFAVRYQKKAIPKDITGLNTPMFSPFFLIVTVIFFNWQKLPFAIPLNNHLQYTKLKVYL